MVIMRSRFCGYLVGSCLLGLALSHAPAKESPPARTDLICPTTNEADCYPKLFQPTKEFQTIKKDQDIPPGLHVRMNIWSGEREARLNIPIEGEDGILDLPNVHESAVVVVPQPEAEEDSQPAMRDRVPQKPPVYEAAGKIQPPPPSDSNDATSFASAITTLTTKTSASYDDALGLLVDLSHDIYYGVEITKSVETVSTLFNLMHIGPDATQQVLAANILGHSVQNNPTALKELLTSWEKDFDQPLGSALYNILKAKSESTVLKAKLYALNGLAKDKEVRDAWLQEGGMDVLLAALEGFGAGEEEKAAIKLVDFVMDTFLDEDMGAEKGIWPHTVSVQMVGVCDEGVAGRGMNGICWERALTTKYSGSGAHEATTEAISRFQESLSKTMGRVVQEKGPEREL